jgi:hypothetical protein
MEEQKKYVNELRLQTMYLKQQLKELETLIENEERECYRICEKENGHNFRRESDGDYHRPRYYQVCEICYFIQK